MTLVHKARITSIIVSTAVAIGMAGILLGACLTSGCAHAGLAGRIADGSLHGCIEGAQAHGDTGLLVYCSAADATVPGVLDLFAARQQQRMARDAGADR